MNNVLRQNKLAIYRLKRNYGLAIRIYRSDENTVNLETGRMIREWKHEHVVRAVLLPKNIEREYIYGSSFTGANGNFVYGGHFDKDTRIVIIDRKDIKDFEVTKDSHILAEGKRYEIKTIVDVEENAALMIVMKATTGNLPVESNKPSPSSGQS
jgi:hypothetical protein